MFKMLSLILTPTTNTTIYDELPSSNVCSQNTEEDDEEIILFLSSFFKNSLIMLNYHIISMFLRSEYMQD